MSWASGAGSSRIAEGDTPVVDLDVDADEVEVVAAPVAQGRQKRPITDVNLVTEAQKSKAPRVE